MDIQKSQREKKSRQQVMVRHFGGPPRRPLTANADGMAPDHCVVRCENVSLWSLHGFVSAPGFDMKLHNRIAILSFCPPFGLLFFVNKCRFPCLLFFMEGHGRYTESIRDSNVGYTRSPPTKSRYSVHFIQFCACACELAALRY